MVSIFFFVWPKNYFKPKELVLVVIILWFCILLFFLDKKKKQKNQGRKDYILPHYCGDQAAMFNGCTTVASTLISTLKFKRFA